MGEWTYALEGNAGIVYRNGKEYRRIYQASWETDFEHECRVIAFVETLNNAAKGEK